MHRVAASGIELGPWPQGGLHSVRSGRRDRLSQIRPGHERRMEASRGGFVLAEMCPKVCPQSAWRRARRSISVAVDWRDAGLHGQKNAYSLRNAI